MMMLTREQIQRQIDAIQSWFDGNGMFPEDADLTDVMTALHMAESYRAAMEGGGELVKRLDALYEKATKGEWEMKGRTLVELEDMRNIEFAYALVNAWPQIRASLATGVPREDIELLIHWAGADQHMPNEFLRPIKALLPASPAGEKEGKA